MNLRTAKILSRGCLALSVLFVAYSLKHYLTVSNVVLPSLATLIASGSGTAEPPLVQAAWLSAVQSYEAFARYQLAGWFVAWVLSVAAVVAVHRASSRAG